MSNVRRGWWAGFGGCSLLGLAAACGAFGSTDGTSPDDAGTGADVSPADADADAGANADADADADAGANADAECVPIKGPTCATIGQCSKMQLYASTGGYPFAIATTADYLYWIEQRAPGDPYNGSGVGSILRKARTSAGTADVLASNQEQAVAITVSGGFVYWTTYTGPDGAPSATHVKRVPVGCTAPCTVADVTGGSTLEGIKILRLLPGQNGTLYMLGAPGHFFHFVPNTGDSMLTNVGSFPSLTATSQALYASGLQRSTVARVTYTNAVIESFATIPPHPQDGGNPGIAPTANDCTTLFGLRQPGNLLYAMPLATKEGKTFDAGSSIGFFDMAADEKWLYGGMPNAGGLYAIDKNDGAKTQVAPANVFAIAVDDVGVYWGDHGGSGAMWMLVK